MQKCGGYAKNMFRINQALGAKANRHPHMMQTKK
jgi:hypothetical protein